MGKEIAGCWVGALYRYTLIALGTRHGHGQRRHLKAQGMSSLLPLATRLVLRWLIFGA